MSTNERVRAMVLGILEDAADTGSTMAEIVFALGDKAPPRKDVRTILKSLTRTGEAVRVDRDLYAVASAGRTFEGLLQFVGSRFHVSTEDGPIEIPTSALGDAIAGDRVSGSVTVDGHPPVGVIETVVDARAPRKFTVELTKFRGLFLGHSPELGEPVQLSGRVEARVGDKVLVEVVERKSFKRGKARGFPGHAVTVRIIEGTAADPKSSETEKPGDSEAPPRIDKAVMLRFVDERETNARTVLNQLAEGLGADQPFEDIHEILASAGKAPERPDEAGHDITHIPFATIDGADAKDFDDAVYAEAGPNKTTRLWVAIADVSSYVEEGNPLDNEARRRGCSVYLPGRVYPMLPFHLADNVCSLRPDELRRCAWVRMDINGKGEVVDEELGFGVMMSRARMTYAEAQEILDGAPTERPAEIVKSVKRLNKLRTTLNAKRHRRGMLDLDLPQPRTFLSPDGAEVVGMQMYPRQDAHRLIEECMLVTNETVAGFLVKQGWPGIFRVHGEPRESKLKAIQQVLREVADGAVIANDPKPRDLVKVFDAVAGTPVARVVSWLVLRTLPRAEYSIDQRLHFGLGTDQYLHFTSPIRRYPDLEVHRMVRRALAAKRAATTEEREVLVSRLAESAEMANAGEQIQTTAERFSEKMMRALYMKDRIGEEYDAMISDIARFGVFVSIEDPYVEGLIHIRSLGREYFEHDERRSRLVGERSGTTFQLGDPMRVVCTNVDVKEGRINFEPVGLEQHERRNKRGAAKRGNRKPRMNRGKPPGVKPSKKRRRR